MADVFLVFPYAIIINIVQTFVSTNVLCATQQKVQENDFLHLAV